MILISSKRELELENHLDFLKLSGFHQQNLQG